MITVKSIDPGGTERKFATRIAGPDYCNAGRRAAAEADGSGTRAPVIKTKTKGKGKGRERMQEKRKRHVEREKRTRSMREMIVYEARGVVYCPCVDDSLSHRAKKRRIEGRGRTLRIRISRAGHGPGPAVVVGRFGRPLAIGCQLARSRRGMTVTGTGEPATYSSNGQPVRRNHCHLDNL
ncbi:hypothetical protein ALC56_11438 [Trachymyrmex septentrionalis]|uniref:Uncharacterized protein n=1 Tax=Trachymyrmex septentrionalis TaxID=34720 RepID=A0A195F1S6_9HYME|nr:hypothetical protein ALC56_11438 [Trachymyrmex septentrionalis]